MKGLKKYIIIPNSLRATEANTQKKKPTEPHSTQWTKEANTPKKEAVKHPTTPKAAKPPKTQMKKDATWQVNSIN